MYKKKLTSGLTFSIKVGGLTLLRTGGGGIEVLTPNIM